MKKALATLVLLSAFALTTACLGSDDDGQAPVTLSLDADAYANVDTVTMTVTNHTDEQIYVDFFCGIRIDILVDGEWQEYFKPDCRNVRVRPTVLPGGESVTYEFPLAPEYLGTVEFEAYRMRVWYQAGNEIGFAESTPFDSK